MQGQLIAGDDKALRIDQAFVEIFGGGGGIPLVGRFLQALGGDGAQAIVGWAKGAGGSCASGLVADPTIIFPVEGATIGKRGSGGGDRRRGA